MQHTTKSWTVPWHLISIFSLLSIGILVLGLSYYEYGRVHFRSEMEVQLSAVADLKVKQIQAWRQERMHDAMFIFGDPDFANEARAWLDGNGPEHLEGQIRRRLAALKQDIYEGIAFFDQNGTVRLSIPDLGPDLYSLMNASALEAMRTGKVVFTDLYCVAGCGKINMTLAVPVQSEKLGERVNVGAVLLQIDPKQIFYPLILSWPIPSPTAEIILTRREDNEIVYLNELRHRKDTALTLRLSMKATQIPAVKAALGHEGIVRGVDYRGVSVLAATRTVPGSPWFLTAKIDDSELNVPIRERSRLVLFLMLTLIAASGLSIAYFWRNRDARISRQQYEAERDRRALAQRYEYLTRYANDIILIMDKDRRIVEANDRAVEAYGYRREEFIGLHLSDLYPEERRDRIADAEAPHGSTLEALHRRKDGTTFPVEGSSSVIEIGGDLVYQQIIRDMTESKRREEALRESEKQLRFLSSQLLIVQENERERISRELHDELGQALMVLKFQLNRLSKEKETNRTELLALPRYLDGVIEKVRRLSWDLSPASLEQFGLSTAIHNLLEEFGAHFHIEWSPEQTNGIDSLFSRLAQINIYRIFQESLTNIGRHANAAQISVSIERREEHVSFTVADDGTGFDLKKVGDRESRARGIGLAAMQERARLAGGSLSIWSQPGSGTKITFDIPMDRSDE